MDTSDEHFDSLCRTCMNELGQATPQDGSTKPAAQCQSVFDVIEEEGSAFAIAELLSNAVPQIELQPSDELPKRICSKCIQQLLSFYRFQRMCLQSEEQMRQQITKKRACFEMIGEAMEGEIGTNDKDSYPLTSFQPNTDQNIVHSSIPRRIPETTEQMVEPEATKTSDIDNDQSLEHSNESQGDLVKNEPIEDDEPSLEYSDGETTLSALSVKDEEWSIDTEEQQITETNVKATGIAQGEGGPYELQHKAIHKGGKRETCDICGKSILKKHLKTHKLIHSDQKPHKCDFCEKSFTQLWNLRRHICKHTGQKQLQLKETCDICGESIIKQYLKTHKLIHSDQKPHKCDFCEKSFALLGNLRLHIRKHTGEKPYKCKYCDRSFAGITPRWQHMRIHLGANVHRCELCPLAFPLASELRVHFLTHTNEDPEIRERNLKALKEAEAKLQLEVKKGGKRKTCDICGESIIKSALKQHKLCHKDEKPHKCNICEKSFARYHTLRVHIRSHTGEKPYKCKYCERSYSQNIDRMKHMRLHFGDNIHRCELCPLAFPVASELRAHLTTHKNDDSETCVRNLKALKEVEAKLQLKFSKQKTENVEAHPIIHGEDRPYGCPYCPRRFRAMSNMFAHKAIHERGKRETCDICGKNIMRSDLETHKLTHSDQKRHKCDFCQKSFLQLQYLRVHIRKHTGEKPYKCKYCDRSFAAITLRRQHMRIHLGANVHRCELCPLAFRVASELRVHLTTHANEDPETRERNMKALKEAEAKLQLKLCKKETRQSLRGVAATT